MLVRGNGPITLYVNNSYFLPEGYMIGKTNYVYAFAAMAALMLSLQAVSAASPIDLASTPVQENINNVGQELQQRAVQYVQEGNFSASHLTALLNETKDDLMRQASEQLNQNLPLSSEELQQRAKEELESRSAQMPGFEMAFSIAGLFCAVILARRLL
jgi:hypothetical protein